MKRLVLAGVALATVVLAACGSEPKAPGPRPTPTPTVAAPTLQTGRTVKDMIGRDVAVPEEVRRVVALSPSGVDFALSLGLELVGRPSDAPNAPQQVPEVGSSLMPDFGAVAERSPDLVLGDAALHGARLRDFEQFPYPVFVLKASSYQDILQALTALGQVTGRDAEAQDRVAEIEERLNAARARAEGQPAPTVLVLTGSGREVYAGSDSAYVGDLVRLLGGTNPLGSAPQGAPIAGFALVEPGQLPPLDPDVVLVITSGQGDLAETVRTSSEWYGTRVVENGRVYELDTLRYLRAPGPSVADAIEELAEMLYPR